MSDKQLFAMFIQEYVVSKGCVNVIMIYGVLIGVDVHKRAFYVHWLRPFVSDDAREMLGLCVC